MPTPRASIEQRIRFLMALSDVTKDNPEVVCKLNELAEAAGLTPDQARYAFIWLLEKVFASGNWHQLGDNANIQITIKGSDEAEWMRLPTWKRFLFGENMRYVAIGVASGIVAGIAVGLVLKYIP